MVTVTERAAEKALRIAEKDGLQKVLRVGVRGGGCSGFTYFYEFDEKGPQPDDHVSQVGELTVVVDPKSMKILDGTVLDYDTHPLKGGWRFNNPNATKTCGCGESFST